MTRPSAPFFCSLLLLVLISFVDFSSGTCFALSLSLHLSLSRSLVYGATNHSVSWPENQLCAVSLCVCVSCGSCVSRRRTCRVRLAQELQFWPQNGHTHRHESDLHTQGTHTQKAYTQLRHSYSHTHT